MDTVFKLVNGFVISHADCPRCNQGRYYPCRMPNGNKYKSFLSGDRPHEERIAAALGLGRHVWQQNTLGGLYEAVFNRYSPVPPAYTEIAPQLRDIRLRHNVEGSDLWRPTTSFVPSAMRA